jgi:hypothetical protein
MSHSMVLEYPAGIFGVDSNAVSDEGGRVKDLIDETREWRWSSLSLGYSREECLKQLFEAYEEAATPGWDGYGARSLHPAAVINAYSFIDALPSNVSMPEVSVHPDGEISFDWFGGARRQFSISLGTRKVLSYAGLFGSDKVTGSERFQGALPRTLIDHIKRVAA